MRIISSLLIAVFLLQSSANAWNEAGHRLIAVLAFELLDASEKERVLETLSGHPRYADDFSPPGRIANKDRWLIGTAGYWPDFAKDSPQWNRPSWHYEQGSTLTLGRVAGIPESPGPLPPDVSFDTQELHVAQAIALCRKTLADPSEPASSKALAISWLCHLVADSHQPCHAGSLYAEHMFPEGDRGANRIPIAQGHNLHALWDGLLGQRYDEGDLARRTREILQDADLLAEASRGVTTSNTLDPQTWLEESRQFSRRYVYTSEVLEPISVAVRAGGGELQAISLTEQYLKNAGRIAQLRAAQAAFRLARILQEELRRPSALAAKPSTRGHAHNDYAHNRPLLDALDHGFCSVEADIFLLGGELLVGHDAAELQAGRTLEALYLAPLQDIVRRNGGHVLEPGVEFQLLIDLKSDGESTYRELDRRLAEYRDMLSEVDNGRSIKRAVSVVISGNRPIELISKQAVRFAAIDGRLKDLKSEVPNHLVPLISDRWTSHFTWRGMGDFPEAQRRKLRAIVQAAHKAERKVRFWATPETEAMWSELRKADVDYINTDDLSGVADFLQPSGVPSSRSTP